MSNSDNLAVIQKFNDALAAFDGGTAASVLADNAEWLIVGPSMGAEPVRGAALAEGVAANLSAMFAPGSLKFNIVRSVVDGNTVVIEFNVTGTTNTGIDYNNWYVNWYELENGKIKLWREHLDTKYAMDTLMGGGTE
jgi:ketosteroid isomerase-like protein